MLLSSLDLARAIKLVRTAQHPATLPVLAHLLRWFYADDEATPYLLAAIDARHKPPVNTLGAERARRAHDHSADALSRVAAAKAKRLRPSN